MDATRVLILLYGLISLFGVCRTAEYCYSWYGGSQFCHYGCCGQDQDDCCEEPFPVYIIVLCTLCGIIVLSVLVALACVFCFKKKKRGRVINPNSDPLFPASIHTTSFIVQQPGYAYSNVYQTTVPPPPSAIPPPPDYYAPTSNAHAQQNDPPPFNRPEGLQSQPPTGGTLPRNRPAAPSGGGLPGNHMVV